MSSSLVIEQVERVVATCAAPSPGRAEITAAMHDLARIESWTAARRAELIGRLSQQPGAFPEADVAETTGCTLNTAVRETERAATLASAGAFADALDTGDIRPGHVDALSRAAKNLTGDQSAMLFDQQAELAAVAAVSTIREFDKHVAATAQALQTEADADARLERQRRATRARSWVDPADGMWCLSARFDPQSGLEMQRMLDDAVSSLFGESTPDTAPRDPRERQQHLAGLALARLIRGETPARTRPGDPIVVVDATTAVPARTARRDDNEPTADTHSDPAAVSDADAAAAADARATSDAGAASGSCAGPGAHGASDADAAAVAGGGVGAASGTGVWPDVGVGVGPVVDWGLPVDLPASVLREIFDVTDPEVVIVANGVVLHAPGRLTLGRTTRLANRAQRRALRGLYSTCAVPGCATHYDRCKLHHIIWWRHGGRTDLDNLLPVCQHHHTKIHDHGWQVTLGPDRQLTVTLPDGTTMTTGPPARTAA